MIFGVLFDPLYEEIVTKRSELAVYLVRHILIELVFPLSIFIAVMLILLIDWNCIPISAIDRKRGISLEQLKEALFKD